MSKTSGLARIAPPIVLAGGAVGIAATIWYIWFAKTRATIGYRAGVPFFTTLTRLSVKLENGSAAWLRADAAASFETMLSAARTDGVDIRLSSAFRSMTEQIAVYAYNGCLIGKCRVQTAPPGHSNHQAGIAFDMDTGVPAGSAVVPIGRDPTRNAAYNWLADNAGSYGFCRTVRTEAHHWEFTGGGDAASCL